MVHSISCLCGKVTQKVHLDLSSNRELNICHCTACQAVSGQIYTSYYSLREKPQLETLEEYQQSDSLSRYFCGTCGSHVFAHSTHTSEYFVASGLLDNPPQTKSVQHWNVRDTRDGGLSSFLPGEQVDTAMSCWLNSRTGSQGAGCQTRIKSASQDSSHLPIRCHCGGVELYITRPDSTSEEPWSHWPDLIIPYNSGVSAENEEDVKWWLCAGKTKYMAGTCACRTCRLASGFPIQTWAFVPKSNIFTGRKLPLAYDVGTLRRYESSPTVYREFCSCCGASVFWHCEKRPQLIDVSVGLLRAESGSRAEEWLDWATGRASFAEMAVDKPLIQQLEAGMKTWNSE
ncbi:GFA family protein [Aspergillus lucknowensis]|uniref:Mss4-like protein n=1 Tax=Aspergillus lucknowensis TaxID=176173 RepID=A0ABR4LML1_9EURO